MDSHYQPELVVLVQFNFRKEIAAVHQGETITFAIIFRGILITEDYKRILLVA